MKNYSRESGIVKAGILRHCKRLCKGLGRPGEKLVTSMIYGVAAANSCHLTEIARALEEEIKIKKTVDRLSRGLQQFKEHTQVWENHLKEVEPYIDETTIYPIDESDISLSIITALRVRLFESVDFINFLRV